MKRKVLLIVSSFLVIVALCSCTNKSNNQADHSSSTIDYSLTDDEETGLQAEDEVTEELDGNSQVVIQ